MLKYLLLGIGTGIVLITTCEKIANESSRKLERG